MRTTAQSVNDLRAMIERSNTVVLLAKRRAHVQRQQMAEAAAGHRAAADRAGTELQRLDRAIAVLSASRPAFQSTPTMENAE